MHRYLTVAARTAGIIVSMGLLSACASIGTSSQLAGADAVGEFDESLAPFGARLALAEGGFTTRVDGIDSYIGR